jgi:Zn-dependent hydrolases, including glyoxylases
MDNIHFYNICGTNAYIIEEENVAILIDPAGEDNAKNIYKMINNTPLKEKIQLIVLTHGHNDHVNGVNFLSEKIKAPILIHEGDMPLIGKSKYALHTRKLIGKIGRKFISDIAYSEEFKPEMIMKGNSLSLEKWGIKAKVIHTPGHTKGSVSIIYKDNIFVGDTFMNIFRPSEALFAENFQQLDLSIKRIMMLQFNMLFPGHGKSFTKEVLIKSEKELGRRSNYEK